MEKAQSYLAIILMVGLAGIALGMFSYFATTMLPTFYGTNLTTAVTAETFGNMVNGSSNTTAHPNILTGSETIYNGTAGAVLVRGSSNLAVGANYTINVLNGTIWFFNVNSNFKNASINYSYSYGDQSFNSPVSVLQTYQTSMNTVAGFLVIVAVFGLLAMLFGIIGGVNTGGGPRGNGGSTGGSTGSMMGSSGPNYGDRRGS